MKAPPKLILTTTLTSDPSEVQTLLVHLMGGVRFHWGRGKEIPTQLQIEDAPSGWNTLAGWFFHDGWHSLTLVYPSKQSVLNALAAVEDIEGNVLHISVVAALSQVDRALRQVAAGNLPERYVELAATSFALTHRAYSPTPLPMPLPPPIPESEMTAAVHSMPMSIFDGTAIPKERERLMVSYAQLFPRFMEGRTTDLVRWLQTFSKYLWSPAWWNSPKLQAFSRSGSTITASLLTIIAELELYARKPEVDYQGFKFKVGPPNLPPKDGKNSPETDQFIETMARLWLQLVELYAGEISVDALKAMLPKGYYRYQYLGIDSQFKIPSRLRSFLDMADAVIADAESQAKYTPFGAFRLTLPQEVVDLITKIPVEIPVPSSDQVIAFQLDLTTLTVFADEDRLWVRFGNRQGDGPIFLWRPDQLPDDNLISHPFRSLANAILAALWRDLRVGGPQVISPPRERAASTEQRSQDGRGRRRSRRPASSPTVRVLPRVSRGGRQGLEIRGSIEWSSPEEREVIKRRAHGVSGFPRRLPEGQKASPEQIEYARSRGVILPKTHTYVRPFMRGLKSGDEPAEILEATPIVSTGLATLMAFLDERAE